MHFMFASWHSACEINRVLRGENRASARPFILPGVWPFSEGRPGRMNYFFRLPRCCDGAKLPIAYPE
jgi:hypothetical protein